MSRLLAAETFEQFKFDYKDNDYVEKRYLDEWDYEDEYSHNQIDEARSIFCDMANNFLGLQKSEYIMSDGFSYAVCNKKIENNIM